MKYLVAMAIFLTVSCAPTYPETKWPGDKGEEILKICWDNSRALMEEACQNPEYVEWDHAPVTVSCEPAIAGMVLQAVKGWNELLGFEIFLFKNLDPEADIVIARGGNHPSIRGITMFFKPKDSMRAGILIFNSALYSMDTYLHELGHAIGLSHDARDTRSIMYPNNKKYFPKIQVIDKNLLIERYSPRHSK